MVDTICKKLLPDKELWNGKLLCCSGGTCTPSPTSCSTTDTLASCHKISEISDCSSRTDTLANTVCQHKDGLLCAEGQAIYNNKDYYNADGRSSTIGKSLLRIERGDSNAGFSFCCDSGWPSCYSGEVCSSTGAWATTCDDFFASGKCLLWSKKQSLTSTFDYQIEVCDSTSNFIATTLSSSTNGNSVTIGGGTTGVPPLPSSPANSDSNISGNGIPSWAIGLYAIGGLIILIAGFFIWKSYYGNKSREIMMVARTETMTIRNEIELADRGNVGGVVRRRISLEGSEETFVN